MPYIVLEALAARKTVIASDVGGISEVLGSDSQALVPAGDSDRMSKAMADSMTEPGWAAANLPEPGHFHDRFSAVTMARRITALYQETLAKG